MTTMTQMVVMKVKTLSCTLLRDLLCNFSNEIVVTHNAMLTYPKENLVVVQISTYANSKKESCTSSFIGMGLQTQAKPMGLSLMYVGTPTLLEVWTVL